MTREQLKAALMEKLANKGFDKIVRKFTHHNPENVSHHAKCEIAKIIDKKKK